MLYLLYTLLIFPCDNYVSSCEVKLIHLKYENVITIVCFCLSDDPEWFMAESLSTGQRGFVPRNFVAKLNSMETEPYVKLTACTHTHTRKTHTSRHAFNS